MCKRVKYSISTKIADSLASGTPILAYGPKEVASFKYLSKYDVAFIANDITELETVLISLIENKSRQQEIVCRACELAKYNHNMKQNSNTVKKVMEQVVMKTMNDFM